LISTDFSPENNFTFRLLQNNQTNFVLVVFVCVVFERFQPSTFEMAQGRINGLLVSKFIDYFGLDSDTEDGYGEENKGKIRFLELFGYDSDTERWATKGKKSKKVKKGKRKLIELFGEDSDAEEWTSNCKKRKLNVKVVQGVAQVDGDVNGVGPAVDEQKAPNWTLIRIDKSPPTFDELKKDILSKCTGPAEISRPFTLPFIIGSDFELNDFKTTYAAFKHDMHIDFLEGKYSHPLDTFLSLRSG